MTTDQLAVMISLCLLLLSSGSAGFKQRARRSSELSYPSRAELSALRS
jgi:hypothetical protein